MVRGRRISEGSALATSRGVVALLGVGASRAVGGGVEAGVVGVVRGVGDDRGGRGSGRFGDGGR